MLIAIVLWLIHRLNVIGRPRSRGRAWVPAARPALRARKPKWVVEEVVRLKAHLAGHGCRKVADTFNRLHAARHGMTVSKTYVATTVRRYRLEIEERRREWKRRIPAPMAVNRVWGLDLTTKQDVDGVSHPILGILDHGSRYAVALTALPDKASITILRALLAAIERCGKPRSIRTDNEAVFVSRVFRLALWLLGIRQQLTERHCPWQNGRVERSSAPSRKRSIAGRWTPGSSSSRRWATSTPGTTTCGLTSTWPDEHRPRRLRESIPSPRRHARHATSRPGMGCSPATGCAANADGGDGDGMRRDNEWLSRASTPSRPATRPVESAAT